MSEAKIKNYTSNVPAARSISAIEQELMDLGATEIVKDAENGQVTALSFGVQIGGSFVRYRLPARVGNVQSAMLKSVKRARKGTAEKIRQQAERTAWKLMLDWVQVQSALIRMNQTTANEVFLPYMLVGKGKGSTLFAMLESRGMGFLQLEGGK